MKISRGALFGTLALALSHGVAASDTPKRYIDITEVKEIKVDNKGNACLRLGKVQTITDSHGKQRKLIEADQISKPINSFMAQSRLNKMRQDSQGRQLSMPPIPPG